MTYYLDLVQEPEAGGMFHYVLHEPGSRRVATACGRGIDNVRRVASFPLGDSRGKVHFDRACETCMAALDGLMESEDL